MSKTVADHLWERLGQWNVERVFGYPGDGINGIMGALGRVAEQFDYVRVRHEEMAAFMACAHAKFTGEVGVCLATSGPGAIHLLNGLYDAKMDHMPVVALVGQQAASSLGKAWFCGLPFTVDERVLVPRSPIGELIEAHFAPWLPATPARILDLCTGSGCIGIACAYAFPEAEVALGDLSYDALEVAWQNIERHGLEERVYTVQGDGFAGLPGQRFDLIVSNPPYVDAEDFADMPAEYQHEPALGLACGDDGLDLVRRMLAEAADHLTEQGILVVEVGNSQVHVEALYPEVDFTWLEFERGGHGVFLLAAAQCREHQALFRSRLVP